MRRQIVGNLFRRQAATKTGQPAPAAVSSQPKPLDADSLKKVAGGAGLTAPHKGW